MENKRITNDIMTHLEFAKLCGTRAGMLQYGATSTIDLEKLPKEDIADVFKIVYAELQQKKCPCKLVRYLPGNKEEYVDPNELYIDPAYYN